MKNIKYYLSNIILILISLTILCPVNASVLTTEETSIDYTEDYLIDIDLDNEFYVESEDSIEAEDSGAPITFHGTVIDHEMEFDFSSEDSNIKGLNFNTELGITNPEALIRKASGINNDRLVYYSFIYNCGYTNIDGKMTPQEPIDVNVLLTEEMSSLINKSVDSVNNFTGAQTYFEVYSINLNSENITADKLDSVLVYDSDSKKYTVSYQMGKDEASEYAYAFLISEDFNIVNGFLPEDDEIIEEDDLTYFSDDISEDSITISNNIPIESTYDNRANLPALRNQGTYGTGWAHAATAMAEAGLIANHSADKKRINLSEAHLAYFTYNSVVDPRGGTKNDSNSKRGGDWKNGGNLIHARNSLANWQGMVDEEVAPYINMSLDELDNSIAYNDYAHLENSYLVSSSNRNDIKRLIKQLGAVGMSFDLKAGNYNNTYNCYYSDEESTPNHTVAIVGWDDNFTATNFNNIPSGRGAWLVRNSFTNALESNKNYNGYNSLYGYFWISYYDKSISNRVYAFDFNNSDNYDNNYQFDGSFTTTTKAFPVKATIANIFKIPTSGTAETLKAISFYTETENLGYVIDIYKNPARIPENGTIVADAHTTGTTSYPGNYTVDLANSIILEPGDLYSVVITLSSKSGKNINVGYESSVDSGIITNAAIEKGQSFYKESEIWKDNSENAMGNWRIKAFTYNGASLPDTYTVLFYGNGSTSGLMPAQIINSNERDRLNPIEYLKTGYDFNGWNTKADGSGTYYDNTAVVYNMIPANSSIKLYAQWKIVTYPISYTLFGGDNNPSNPTSYNVKKKVTLLAPTRKGYDFVGWYADADYTKPVSSIELGSVGRRVFYAKWKVAGYKITYVMNGGKNNSENPSKYTGASTIILKTPSRQGYKFGGWYTDSKFKNRVTEITKGTKGDKTFYAKWNGYKITYHLNGGSNSKKNPKTYTGDMIVYLQPAKKSSYSFAGWYTDPKYRSRIKDIVRGSKGDLDLYAKWERNVYHINFKGNKATSGKMASLKYQKCGKEIRLPANKYKRDGYYFAGWNTKANGKGTAYPNKGKFICKSTRNYKTINLYAMWRKSYYNIKFDGNGASYGKMKSIKEIDYDKKIKLPANKFVREGYRFIGWNTKIDGTGKWYKDRATVSKLSPLNKKTVILYAIWEIGGPSW